MPHSEENKIIPEGASQIALFKDKEIRQVFHDNEWWFSVIDVIEALTGTERPRKYWADLKSKITSEDGGQLSDKIGQLKLEAADGKMYTSDVATPETLFRIIQSIPSPKAEPFKRWLAKVGYERIKEYQNPEIAIKRAMLNYRIKGYSDEWIDARVRTIISRKELTQEWQDRGVEGKKYGVLTDTISEETFGVKTREHKDVKSLTPTHNLRDHMTDFELILTMLGEKSTTAIAKKHDAQGFKQNLSAARAGGSIAGSARKDLEEKLGESVVSKQNYLNPSDTEEQKRFPVRYEDATDTNTSDDSDPK
jgi:hypothetical protein